MNTDRWLVVTAGVGSPQFEAAAQRIVTSFRPHSIVDRVVGVDTKQLSDVCPKTSQLFMHLMNVNTRGYGYMCWKAEVVKSGFDGLWGDFEGVIWVDAGCEVTINPISRLMFRKFQTHAKKYGVACFTLDTLEIEYTKRDLFDLFPNLNPESSGKQIQSTWFFLYGNLGRKIAQEWFETVMKGPHLLELTPSKNPEYSSFIENRYDQSAFSLVCKSNSVIPMNYRPTNGHSSLISKIRGTFHPIWTSRNRDGKSIKTILHRLLECNFRQ